MASNSGHFPSLICSWDFLGESISSAGIRGVAVSPAAFFFLCFFASLSSFSLSRLFSKYTSYNYKKGIPINAHFFQLQLTNRCTPTEEGIQTTSDKIMTAPTMFSSRNLTVCHMIVMWLPWDIYNILTNGSCIKIRKQVKQESAKVRIGRNADSLRL